MPEDRVLEGAAAGVPYLASPPKAGNDGAPVVVIWHMTDPPRSETAMAAALPLSGLDAWRLYLGLPLTGSRLPDGGLEAFFQLGYEDAVLELFDPITRQAVEEFPQWTEPSRAAAERLDFVARAEAIADRNVATLLVVGENDDREGIHEPAQALSDELSRRSPDRASVVRIPGLEHALAEEPGLEPAPQAEPATRVDSALVDWLGARLLRR